MYCYLLHAERNRTSTKQVIGTHRKLNVNVMDPVFVAIFFWSEHE